MKITTTFDYRQIIQKFILFLTVVCVTGCATIRPDLKGVVPGEDDPNPYKVAVSSANKTKEVIIGNRRDLRDFDFYSGTALIGTGLAGAGFGAFGAHKDAIMASALTAGGIISGRSYIPFKGRQAIYAKAIKEINDAVLSTSKIEKIPRASRVSLFALAGGGDVGLAFRQNNNPDVSIASTHSTLKIVFSEAESEVDSLERLIDTFNADANRAILLNEALVKIVNDANDLLAAEEFNPNKALEDGLSHIKSKLAEIEKQKAVVDKELNKATTKLHMSALIFSSQTKGQAASVFIEARNIEEGMRIELERLKDRVSAYFTN